MSLYRYGLLFSCAVSKHPDCSGLTWDLTGRATEAPPLSYLQFCRLRASSLGEHAELIMANPSLHYHVISGLQGAFVLETVFVMYRRMMLGAMVDPMAQMIAVILTALEETLLRSTMVYRDELFARFLGYAEPSAAEASMKRKVWAARYVDEC